MFQKLPTDFYINYLSYSPIIKDEEEEYREYSSLQIYLFPDDPIGITADRSDEGLKKIAAYFYNLGLDDYFKHDLEKLRKEKI